MRIGECDSPIVHEAGQEVPSIAFIGSPGSATRSGGYYRLGVAAFPAACIRGIAEPVHRTTEWSGCGELPVFPAIARARNVVRKVVGLENFSATEDAVKRVAEVDAGYTRSGRTLRDGRVVGLPCLATVGSGKDAGLRSATGTYPRAVLTLCGHASSTGSEGGFPGQCGRQVVTDVLPSLTVAGASHWETAVDGVDHNEAASRRPEREAVEEFVRILILKFEPPGISAIFGFINASIGTRARREQVSHLAAESLHVAKFEILGAGDHMRLPVLTTIGREYVGSAHTAGPNHLRVHRTDCLKAHRSAALLAPESRCAGLS
jgi:hypothetical protein